MAYSIDSSRSLFVAAVLALPFFNGGCGREACFTWSKLEGACPAQSEALPFFTNPACPGKITSVESEGHSDLDGSLCCYQVTEREQSDESLCQGFGGAGSSQAVGQGGDESSNFAAAVAASSVGAGGASSCAHCGDVLSLNQPIPLCPEAEPLFKVFVDCACSGACAAVCGDNFCMASSTSPDCFTCLEDKAGCMMQFSACANQL